VARSSLALHLLRALSEARLGTCGGGRVGVVERTVADERKIAAAQELAFSILLSAHCHRPCLPFAYRWLASTGECQPLSATLPSVNGEHRGHDPAAEVAVCSMPRMPTSVSGRLLAAGNSAGLGALPTLPNSCDALAFANVLDFLHLSAVAADALANCYV
jgi:hypothetical protein